MDTRSVADWILALEPAAIPPGTAERLRLQLAAVLASLLDGLRLPEVAALIAPRSPHTRLVSVGELAGGWAAAQSKHFAAGGLFDRVFRRVREGAR